MGYVVVSVNLMAVLASAIASMVLGMIWYSPQVLGNAWMKETGKKMLDMKKHMKDVHKSYAIMFVGALVMAYVMGHLTSYAGARTLMDGAMAGFWAWLGFAATVMLGSTLFEGKSWNYYGINAGYHLVQFLMVGAIMAVWL